MTDFHITRRKFIGTAATVAAFNIVPRHVLGGANQKSPGEKLELVRKRFQ
jgi:hypothetical protein